MLTDNQVEDGFSYEPEYEYHNPIGYGAHVQGNRRAFRRWLAEVERAAAAKALTDAADDFERSGLAGLEPVVNLAIDRVLRARAAAYRREETE